MAPSLILGIDTAVGGMSISLVRGGEEIAGFADPAQQDQAALLVPMIERVLAEACVSYADLDGIAVTIGPGGFTGVRIGLATARGIAFAAGKKLRGVTTLALISDAAPARPLRAVIPAGRELFYSQYFTPQGESEPELCSAADVFVTAPETTLACPPGPWIDALPERARFVAHDHSTNARRAALIAARLGFAVNIAEAMPLYIRPPDAKPQAPLIPA